jgi:hypothetical protein
MASYQLRNNSKDLRNQCGIGCMQAGEEKTLEESLRLEQRGRMMLGICCALKEIVLVLVHDHAGRIS